MRAADSCAAFGIGAAAGSFLAERMPTLTLTVLAAERLLVLLLCGAARPVEAAKHAERGPS